MNSICLIVLTFVSCTHSLSFQFAATQSPNRQLHYGDKKFAVTCDPTRKCATDTTSRSTCERWGCCFQNNKCYSTKHFIMNEESSEKKAPALFTVPVDDEYGGPIGATRAEALKYCQDNFPNGQLAVPTATDDWLTLSGRTEKFKNVDDSIRSTGYEFHIHLDYYWGTDDVTTVDGEFFTKGADFQHARFYQDSTLTTVTMLGLRIENGSQNNARILCQHD